MQAGNGHDCFQSRSPWTAPLKEGATIHHLKVVCCALPGASCGKRMIARSVPAPANPHRGSYTSPALAAASYPFVDLPSENILQLQAVLVQQVYKIILYLPGLIEYNENNDKSEFVERFLELSLFYGLSSPLNSEMICIFPYF